MYYKTMTKISHCFFMYFYLIIGNNNNVGDEYMYYFKDKYRKNSFIYNRIDYNYISTKSSSIKESRWNNDTF